MGASARGLAVWLAPAALGLSVALSIVPAVGRPAAVADQGSSTARPDRSDDWLHLFDALTLTGAASDEQLAAADYDISMAGAAANCSAEEPASPQRSLADAAVEQAYSRLRCHPQRTRAVHHRWGFSYPRAKVIILRAAVAASIARGAALTGIAPGYLLATASAESGLRTDARAPTSSAAGLFQFIDSTWLTTVRRYGSSLGLERAASEISLDGRGRPFVENAAARSDILALRSDALISTVLAGLLTRENARRLNTLDPSSLTAGELYAAHALGPAGASTLLRLAKETPQLSAASVFPVEAQANRRLFYRGSRAVSLLQLVNEFHLRAGA